MNTVANVIDQTLGKRQTDVTMEPKTDPNNLMSAIVWKDKWNLDCVLRPKPLLTDAKDIILKVTATTICGSDLHMYSGNMMTMKEGDVLGHEFMGTVEEVGPEVQTLKLGQRVVCAFNIACGTCDFCKREEYTECKTSNPNILEKKLYGHRTSAIFGYSHLTGGVMGGQAEYVRIPFADINCLVIPDEITDEQALFLSDVVPTAYWGTEMGDVKKDDIVGIWGLGPVGLMCARWCQLRGAGRVIGIDCVPDRLEIAKNVLRIQTINYNDEDVYEEIMKVCPDGIDVGIECAGFEYAKTWRHKIERAVGLETDTADILTEIFKCVRGFGRVAILGVYSGTANHFPIGTLMEKGLTVRGGQCPTQRFWKMALKKIASGELDPTFIISHHSTLDKAPELYQQLYDHKEGVIKVFLRPNFELTAKKRLEKEEELIKKSREEGKEKLGV